MHHLTPTANHPLTTALTYSLPAACRRLPRWCYWGNSLGGACSTSRPAAPVGRKLRQGSGAGCYSAPLTLVQCNTPLSYYTHPWFQLAERGHPRAASSSCSCLLQPAIRHSQGGSSSTHRLAVCCRGTSDTSSRMLYTRSKGTHLHVWRCQQEAFPPGPMSVWVISGCLPMCHHSTAKTGSMGACRYWRWQPQQQLLHPQRRQPACWRGAAATNTTVCCVVYGLLPVSCLAAVSTGASCPFRGPSNTPPHACCCTCGRVSDSGPEAAHTPGTTAPTPNQHRSSRPVVPAAHRRSPL